MQNGKCARNKKKNSAFALNRNQSCEIWLFPIYFLAIARSFQKLIVLSWKKKANA